ncbi:MAG: hypothetical protein JXR07_10565 [Reichenbachiella sp.]
MDSNKNQWTSVSKNQILEFGLVAMLVVSAIAYWTENWNLILAVAFFSLVLTISPIIVKPLAIFWYGLSRVLNGVSSKLILGFVFFLVITPIGLIRRMVNSDTLKLNEFRKGKKSVLHERNHLYSAEDFNKTF